TSGNTREVVRTYDYLNSYLDYKYDRTIKAIQSYWLAVDYYRKGKFTRAQACAAKRVWTPPFNSQAVMAGLLTYLPPLHRLVSTFRQQAVMAGLLTYLPPLYRLVRTFRPLA